MRKWEQQMIVKDNCEPMTGIRKPPVVWLCRCQEREKSRQRSSLKLSITVHAWKVKIQSMRSSHVR